MKQILQSLQNGTIDVADVPSPGVKPGHLLITAERSLISAGTERMLLQFGRASWIGKARRQPEKLRQVLQKIRTDGLWPTIESVRSRLAEPQPLGYCHVGRVIAVGRDVTGFEIGDRVASNGLHAETVCVPKHLCARIPDGVDDESATFTVLAAIGLQGIRLVQPTMGERVAVMGLGLIGLIAVQLLKANGCQVLGLDFSSERLKLAREFGAETVNLASGDDPVAAALAFSNGDGMDAVLIAAATKSSDPVHQAAQMSRRRGRIVLTGVTGLELSRADFYEKELSFQVSCSYGPGRYDSAYEQGGQDYPIEHVRWTENRNFQAVLKAIETGELRTEKLVTHRFGLGEAQQAYDIIDRDPSALGVVLDYSTSRDSDAQRRERTIAVPHEGPRPRVLPNSVGVAVVGAGGFARQVLIPAFASAGARLESIVTQSGYSGYAAARRYHFASMSTDLEAVLKDPQIDAVVIATRHNSHAKLACQALAAGKHVFVEKPLGLTNREIDDVIHARDAAYDRGQAPIVMVGFNRRFSPHIVKMKSLLAGSRTPLNFVFTVNAGAIPADHWTQDPRVGGGRIIGEGCHFVDTLRFLAGAPIVDATVTSFSNRARTEIRGDKVSCMLQFAGGSMGTIHYLANGHKSFPKERLEVFSDRGSLHLDNFRTLFGQGYDDFKTMRLRSQDKGHRAEVSAFLDSIRHATAAPIPFEELVEVSRTTIALSEAAQGGTRKSIVPRPHMLDAAASKITV